MKKTALLLLLAGLLSACPKDDKNTPPKNGDETTFNAPSKAVN